jgi:hypothetical protein
VKAPAPSTLLVSVDGSEALEWQLDLLSLSREAVAAETDLQILRDVDPVLHHHYPPSNRPFAVRKWIRSRRDRSGHVCVVDPDMVLLRPIDVTPREGDVIADLGTYPFGDETLRALRRHVVRPDRVPLGIPPIFIAEADLASVVDAWVDVTAALWADSATRRLLGWLCEMWAFPLAAQRVGLRVVTQRLAHVPPAPPPARPLVLHYAWRTPFFDKTNYRPWRPLDHRASLAYDPLRKLIDIARRRQPLASSEAAL